MKRVVVLGSNSFSGSHFVRYCLEDELEVLGISRSEEPEDMFLPYKACNLDHFQFQQGDLNQDLQEIIDILRGFQPNYIVNFASQGMVAQSWESPVDWFRTNTLSQVGLHDAIRKMTSLEKYVHISTPEVYGTCEGVMKESRNYQPSTPYAVSRAAADMSLYSFYEAYDFPVVFTRAANVFGPGQQLYRIIPRTILAILTGKKLQLHGGGHSVRSFIHIEDVCRATSMLMKGAPSGNIYHISTDRYVSIRALVELILEHLDAGFDDYVDIVGDRLGKDQAYLLDSGKIKDEFGWSPEFELEKGIAETIAWIQENLERMKQTSWEYIHKK